MNNTLEYIAKKYSLDLSPKPPICIVQTGRDDMARTLAELGFTIGAEIGVAQGIHSQILCEAIPNLHLYCIDVWEPYYGYNEYQDRITLYHKEALARLESYNCTFIKQMSMHAVQEFENGELDFVYIDGAHDFQNVVNDLCEWSKKVRIGGIVYGHDYNRKHDKYIVEVKDAVQAFCYTKGIHPWFILDIPSRLGGESWMYVRQETDWL